MLALILSILASAGDVDLPPEPTGTIHGVVIDGSQGGAPMEGVDVILRAGADGELIPVAKTTTDLYGKFAFSQVPLEPTIEYLPGADRDGVHYPGPRVRLGPSSRAAHARIVTFNAVAAPCPLVATRHDVDVTLRETVMEITETVLVTNPTRTAYVGRPAAAGDKLPVTLQLSIPENFDRVTFGSEFHGRRFQIVDRRLVTDIPWPPGQRELRFTYRVPCGESAGVFRRPLDLPTSHVQVRVRGENAAQATCNLPRSATPDDGVAFASVDERLPAGYTIEMQLGTLPTPWGAYARWGAILLFAVLVLATVALQRRRARQTGVAHPIESPALPNRDAPGDKLSAPGNRQKRAARRGKKRRAA